MNSSIVQQRENQSRNFALIGTVIVHALMILGLLYLVLTPPNPPLGGGQGMSMMLGEDDMGGESEIPVVDPDVPEPQTPTPVEEVEAVATQDIEEAPEVVTKKEPVKKTTPVVKPPVDKKPVEKPREVDQRSLFKKRNSTSTASGFGSGDAPGNQGSPDGDPKGSPDGGGTGDGDGSGKGNGTGNGIGDGTGDGVGHYELNGRSITHRPVVVDNSRETGKVVVQIVVDRNGKVIRAVSGYKGSTTLHPSLVEKARQGAMDARFNAKPDGPEEQYGTITFIFKFRQ